MTVKYPWASFLAAECIILFGGLAIWGFTDRFFDLDGIPPSAFQLCIGTLSFIWIVLALMFGRRLIETERNNRNVCFEERIRSGKPVVLVVKRKFFANMCLIFALIFFIIPFVALFSPVLSDETACVYFCIWALGFVYGLIFSFLIHKKKITFEKGKFDIEHTKGRSLIDPDRIVHINFLWKRPVNGTTTPEPLVIEGLYGRHETTIAGYNRYYGWVIEIELSNGQKLLVERAEEVNDFWSKYSKCSAAKRLF